MTMNLRHHQTGAVKQAKLGFSWTTLFFGFLVPLLRGDVKWALIMFIVSTVTFGIAWIIFPFIYNTSYIKGVIEKGYVPADDYSKSQLEAKGMAFQTPSAEIGTHSMTNGADPVREKPRNDKVKQSGNSYRHEHQSSLASENSMIKFKCSNCNKTYSASRKYSGKHGQCKNCGEEITVP